MRRGLGLYLHGSPQAVTVCLILQTLKTSTELVLWWPQLWSSALDYWSHKLWHTRLRFWYCGKCGHQHLKGAGNYSKSVDHCKFRNSKCSPPDISSLQLPWSLTSQWRGMGFAAPHLESLILLTVGVKWSTTEPKRCFHKTHIKCIK